MGGPTLGCVSTQPRHPNAQRISGPEEALGKDVSTSPGTAGTTSPPPEDVGLASFGPSLRPPAESDSVSFPPRSQPHEASRSFRGGSDTGTSVLTCAQTTRGRRLALPQCQLAARAQEAPEEAGRGGTGAGLPRPGPVPCAGPGQAPLHLPSSSSSPPEVGHQKGSPGSKDKLHEQRSSWKANAGCSRKPTKTGPASTDSLEPPWRDGKRPFIQDTCLCECFLNLGPWVQQLDQGGHREPIWTCLSAKMTVSPRGKTAAPTLPRSVLHNVTSVQWGFLPPLRFLLPTPATLQ
ncbi:hypothetical protein J1605_008576 [Eschrichtius robustus]|uniref:Uncharacterized protein n=1 Tax=Eschrichtius robustus TaxID=9764 RepID=A0AB34GUB9_ESCRO|nr:hypothetical protein J1605_008576 [Eschrichtius robustus]